MITGDVTSKVDLIWDAFWSGGISNPVEVIEQITYLLFIRQFVGLDRAAAMDAFTALLDEHTYSVEQIDFVKPIITELTERGVVEPGRLHESPSTDRATRVPDFHFADVEVEVEVEVDGIVSTLQSMKRTTVPTEVA